MKKTLTANAYLPILLIAVLVLLVVPNVAFASVIHEFFYGIVTTVFGWLVGVAAIVLNYGINNFVINFGQQYLTTGVGAVIETTWATIRDIFNLTFIFGLVYIGFKMILRSDDSNTRRWLVNLVIAALLVNFSLFITKFVIDFSNILAVEIMNLDDEIFPLASDLPVPPPDFGPNDIDLSGSMQQLTNINTVNEAGDLDTEKLSYPEGAGFTFIFGTMFLYIVTAFVYFSAGILLIIRGVVLFVLMIVSPLLFLGMVLPMFQGFSRNLWNTLLKRAFLAPIYVTLLYISMSVASGYIGASGSNFSGALAADNGASAISSTAGAFGPFIIVVVLLLGSLSAAQKLGAEGAGAMIKMGNSLQRYGRRQVGNASFGGAAKLGRGTVGAGADRLAKSSRFKRLAASSGITGYMAKGAMRGTQKVADTSFDARNVAGMGKATGLGTGKKGGFKTRTEEKQKKEADMLEHIGTRDVDSAEGKAEVSAFKAEMLTRKAEHDTNKDMSVDELEKQIGSLETGVGVGREQLEKAKREKTMSAGEIGTLEAEVEMNEKLLEQNKQLLVEKQAIEQADADILAKQAELAEFGDNTDNADASYLKTEIENLTTQKQARQTNIDAAGSTYGGRAVNAENEIKYKDQMDYIASLEKTQQTKQRVANVLTGKSLYDMMRGKGSQTDVTATGAGYPSGAAVGAGVGLGAGTTMGGMAAGGAVAAGMAHQDGEVIKGLKKKFGKDSIEMAKKDSENKNIAKLMKEIKEQQSQGGVQLPVDDAPAPDNEPEK